MEETTPSTAPKNSSPMKFVIPVAVVAIVLIAALFFYTQSNTQTESMQQTNTPSTAQEQQQPTQEETASSYTNGTYTSEGEYISPGGPRTIDLTITLADGIITDSEFVGTATDPTSQRFQGEFGDNYEAMIVGKNIDEVSLTKVAGSSLTPQGFTDALEKIKTQAQS